MRRITVVRAAMAAGLAALVACGDAPFDPSDAAPVVELPRALAPHEADLLSASNRFGFSLLRELAPAQPTSNLFFSPLSVSAALAMALNGANGRTFDQMRSVLGMGGLTREEINASYASLFSLLQGLDPEVTVDIANALWHRPDLDLDPAFRQRVADAFGAAVGGVDFTDAAAAAAINEWVTTATDGTISELVDELDPNTAVLLANAVYFRGKWTRAFAGENTAPGPFTLGDGSTTTASFMSGRTEIAFGRTDRFDVIEIPYGGQAFAMTIVLPHVGSDPLDVVGDIDAAGWASLTEGLDTLETNLELPKFEVSWEKAVEDDLAEIGMPDAFDPLAADFTGMVAGGNLWIDQVLQKSFVRVDEAGTVASAATSVHMVDTAFMPMRVDRPFLFAIRERLTGTVLFLGILRDPGA